MFELMNGLKSILENCMHVKSGESVLVITDNEGEAMWIGHLMANIIESIGAVSIHTIIAPKDSSDVEPPAAVAAAMKNTDALIFISDKIEANHTNAHVEARAAGTRCYVINSIPVDDLKKGVSPEDLIIIKKRTETIAERLAKAKFARLTSPQGTDLTMSIAGRGSLEAYPSSLETGVLPDYAESATTPVEGTAEGIIVADLAILQWNYILREPLCYKVSKGRVVDVSGSKEDVQRMRQQLKTDDNANNIAEFGIGTSHIIPHVMRGTRRDAARIGTAHIGMGRNNDIGGNTFSRIHFDSLISQVSIELDGESIMENGKLLI